MRQVQLTILGKPVTFASDIEACRTQGKNPDGSWPRGKCKTLKDGDGGGGKKTVRKATAQPTIRRGTNEQDRQVQQRHAEVDKIIKKKDHFGIPGSEITNVFETMGERKGFKANLGEMSVTYRGRNGAAKLSLHPKGFRVTAPANPAENLPALDQIFTDINLGRNAMMRHAGEPGPAQKRVS